MKIMVRLYGGLERHTPSNPHELDVPQSTTVADVIESLDLRPGEVWLATLDDRLVERDHPLQPGDKLTLIPPVGGGTQKAYGG